MEPCMTNQFYPNETWISQCGKAQSRTISNIWPETRHGVYHCIPILKSMFVIGFATVVTWGSLSQDQPVHMMVIHQNTWESNMVLGTTHGFSHVFRYQPQVLQNILHFLVFLEVNVYWIGAGLNDHLNPVLKCLLRSLQWCWQDLCNSIAPIQLYHDCQTQIDNPQVINYIV